MSAPYSPARVILTEDQLHRIGQLCDLIETTIFPSAYYLDEQRRDLAGIAAELRRIVGLPVPVGLWPELAANAEPIPLT